MEERKKKKTNPALEKENPHKVFPKSVFSRVSEPILFPDARLMAPSMAVIRCGHPRVRIRPFIFLQGCLVPGREDAVAHSIISKLA